MNTTDSWWVVPATGYRWPLSDSCDLLHSAFLFAHTSVFISSSLPWVLIPNSSCLFCLLNPVKSVGGSNTFTGTQTTEGIRERIPGTSRNNAEKCSPSMHFTHSPNRTFLFVFSNTHTACRGQWLVLLLCLCLSERNCSSSNYISHQTPGFLTSSATPQLFTGFRSTKKKN